MFKLILINTHVRQGQNNKSEYLKNQMASSINLHTHSEPTASKNSSENRHILGCIYTSARKFKKNRKTTESSTE